MTDTTTWQVLFVDDKQDICQQVKEFLEGETIGGVDEYPRIETYTDFSEALDTLETRQFDLVILDVRVGAYDQPAQPEEAGIKTLEAIQQRRFVPIVFYTGLPHLVRHLETPLIKVVEKGAGPKSLLEAVRNIFNTRLPAVNRALIRHMETVQRDYMWDFVATHWKQFGDTPDRAALAYLLARRLAMSLSGTGIQQFAKDLGDPWGASVAEGRVHPMQYYVIPPVEVSPLAGDLYQGQIGSQTGYWVLLTPSCDFVKRDNRPEKAKWALLAHCDLLTEQLECLKWQAGLPQPSQTTDENLRSLIGNNRRGDQPERFYFLPGTLTLPDLMVDLQQLVTAPRDQLDNMERLASLDSPFAEALLARFARYFGRPGTPDLDVEYVLTRLRSANDQGTE